MIIETIKVTTISQNKVYIPQNIMKRFGFKNGDKIVWGINRDGEIIIEKNTKSTIIL